VWENTWAFGGFPRNLFVFIVSFASDTLLPRN
jgi:hypothetical protein